MTKIAYYLLLKPISLLPYWVLYRLSDLLYLIFATVFPYRRKVAYTNIQRSFPELSEKEHRRILKRFYRHFCDLIVESFKNFSISEKQINKRMKAVNPEVIQEVIESNQGVVLCGGHYNNWELWAVAAALHIPGTLMAIYKRLSNPFLDQKMKQTRGKFGLTLIPTVESSEWMKSNAAVRPVTSVYGIDQSPANPRKAYWMDFLSQETACYFGPEKHAKDFNMAVVFGHMRKIRRGYYDIVYTLVTTRPREYESGKIVEEVNRLLEKDIRATPEFWLWTHKRWKHSKSAEM